MPASDDTAGAATDTTSGVERRDLEPHDHLRLRESEPAPGGSDTALLDPGVYRVVGTGDPVALLQVGDADGRRVTSGRVVRVAREDLSAFEPAPNPDGNRSVAARVAGAVDGLRWQVRSLVAGWRAQPVAALAFAVLFGAGTLAEARVPGPEWVATVLGLVGAVGLAFVGTRFG